MIGLGYRREMFDWDPRQIGADFFEVAPENWVRRDRTPLHRLREAGFPVYLHGVSLNLGGHSPIQADFVRDVGALLQELDAPFYSDHLAASGDAHQLYDLFPIPFTEAEARRVADRIQQVQDLLGRRIAVENSSYYTNIGELGEAEFLMRVVEQADCHILLDVNNIQVNFKNHGRLPVPDFLRQVDLDRVSYLHVAGHEFDARFDLFIDTHSARVEAPTAAAAGQLQRQHGKAMLLEWDNDLPDLATIKDELQCLRASTTT